MPETWRGPGVKFAHLSYDADLSTDHSVKCRQLIDSPWYQERWGERFTFRKDQNLKTRYLNTASGERLSGTMHGITGYGANIIVYDDPHDIQSVESDIKRKEVLKFWTEILPNRLNPDAPGAFIVIMQRSHARDLAGYIIAHEFDATLVDVSEWTPTTWRHICLPARHEKKHAHPLRTDLIRKGTDQIWTDPREEGEALWPELFPLSELDRRESTMTPYAVAGQMQQRPVAREGGMFKREWFGERQFLESTDIPPGTKWVRHWDLAATESATADYTCGLKLGRMADGRFVVGDIIRVQKEGHEVRALIEATAALDGRYCEISLPKDPGQAGKVQAADFVRTLAGYVVHADAESGSKEVRAEPVAAQAAHGNLCMRRAPWNEAFLDELCMFPAAPHDDQADALSGAFARFVLPIGEHSSGFMTGLH
jgi:predicted phage terminase large subunit-like protein